MRNKIGLDVCMVNTRLTITALGLGIKSGLLQLSITAMNWGAAP